MHPIVVQMSPSDEQWPAILARGCDVAVTAGAGTGKTRTLVARYLALLAEGLPLRAVVAITFTRKAAREMRSRVRDEMRRYLDRPDLDDGERQAWQRRYSELDAARIGTIHSLCAEILRAHPAEAGVDPRFAVLEEGQVNILRGRAVAQALASLARCSVGAADDERAVAWFALLGERALQQTLDELLKQRLDAADCLAHLPDPLWPAWEAILVPPIRAFVDDDQVRAAFAELQALRADGTLARAAAAGDTLAGPLQELLARCDEIVAARQQEDWPAVSVRLAPLRGAMQQKGRAANWRPAEPKALIGDLQALYDERLGAVVGKGIDLALDRQLAEALPALRAAFATAGEWYDALKRERNALDFDDLEGGALALLREHPAVQAHWQAEVQALLVDEFQDTNARQRDLVALLNGGRGRLFIVGDAKQSIYRFRGADVTVFRAERVRIAATGAAFDLATSYRAHRDLIRGLNDLLRPVLGERADPARPWVEPFAPLQHHRTEPGPGFGPAHIELHLTVGSKSGGALDRAADAVAARLVELVASGAQAVKEGQVRPLDYGDIAILCRSSTSFSAYEDALERAGVPFLTVAGRGFYGRPEVRDLLNALLALADPTDDLALAGLLRSPACALSDAALYRLAEARSRAGGAASLWGALRAASLPGEDGRRAARAVRLIAGLHGQVGRSPVADLLKAFLEATDYRAALLQAGQTRAARNVAKLLADAHASGIVGAGEFLEYVNGLRDSGTREGEARATAEGAVQIMSVHAAKGLEFPVVVIGDATYDRRGDPAVLLDPELGLLLPLAGEDKARPAAYRQGQARAADQEAAELNRLLYVAATRASEKLLVSGCIGLRQDGTPGRLSGWLGQIAGPDGLGLAGVCIEHDDTGARAHGLELRLGETSVSCTIYEPGCAGEHRPRPAREETAQAVPLPPPWLPPVQPETASVDERTAEQDRLVPQRVWRVVPPVERPTAPAWVIGSLVHEALAAWRGPDAGFARWAAARARGYGLTDARQLADAVQQSRRLLQRFRESPLYQEMERADQRLHEVPYSLVADGRVESGIMDALYRRGEGWTLVEFKTDDVRNPADFAALLAEQDYLAQARRYLAAAERLLGQRPRFVLCMLNYAGGVHVETDLVI